MRAHKGSKITLSDMMDARWEATLDSVVFAHIEKVEALAHFVTDR